ncbi:MAG: cytoplasmic protein [Thermodesulfobacteriota bacterium]
MNLNDPRRPGRPGQAQFKGLEATQLYCPNCRRAMPVRSRLLLVLPDGDKYEYLCAGCGTSVGEKLDKGAPQIRLLV